MDLTLDRGPAVVAAPGTVGAAVWLAMAETGRRLRQTRRQVLSGSDTEHLHRLRVCLRRVRAIVEVGRDAMDLPHGLAVDALRPLGRAVGRVRDLDVALDLTAPLVPVAKGAEAKSLDRIQASLRRHRRRALPAIRRELSGKDVTGTIRLLRRWVRQPRFYPVAFRQLDATLATLLEPAVQRLRAHEAWGIPIEPGHGLEAGLSAQLHQLRKRVKAVRDRLELMDRGAPEHPNDMIVLLTDVQDTLGRVHDVDATVRAVRSAAAEHSIGSCPVVTRHLNRLGTVALKDWADLRDGAYRGTVSMLVGAE